MVDLVLESAVTVPPPIETNWPRHEVDSHNKAQGEDRMLRFAFIFLEDVHTGESKKCDPHDPEESAKQDVQEIEGEPKEERNKPVGKQDGAN